ncbi:transcription termination factor Rho [Lachnospiraceae bacterium XBB1006]|nr:transcription termination factor Rho [Lachnospiraceae bacterium XBB1006]
MREKYESLSVAALRDIAQHRGLKVSGLRKAEIIDVMVKKDEEEKASQNVEKRSNRENNSHEEVIEVDTGKDRGEAHDGLGKERYLKIPSYKMTPEEAERDRILKSKMSDEVNALDSGKVACGILEVMSDGYGFIRSDNFLPGEVDVYVAPSLIRRFRLKTGDRVKGKIRIPNQGEKYSALLYLLSVNEETPENCFERPAFEELTPIFPDERLHMEHPGCSTAMRVVDLIAPIGKGQRGMIVSPPKAGKTTLLKQVAKSLLYSNPKTQLIILLIDERPEEVTDIKEAIQGTNVEVIYSTFDELPEHHKRVAEMVLERGKRLVEHGHDVVILLDSITRLTRAYNLTVPPSGRTLTGGLDPAALHMPKKFFGAARNMREGGSLTVLATALVDTGSKMDDVVYEEFKGTGNMELVLDRKLSERRVFPAVDVIKSGTRREDLLLSPEERQAMDIMRRGLNGSKPETAAEYVIRTFANSRNNQEVVKEFIRKKVL